MIYKSIRKSILRSRSFQRKMEMTFVSRNASRGAFGYEESQDQRPREGTSILQTFLAPI